MIQVETTPYGADARRALAAEIARLKGGDPLRPVSVVVVNPIGIAARRALGHAGGIAAVTFLTPYRLAELLGAAAVIASGRRPLSTPVLAGAVRAVLADERGTSAGSPPTRPPTLARAPHRTLSEVDPTGLERLAATSPRTADVVRVRRRSASGCGRVQQRAGSRPCRRRCRPELASCAHRSRPHDPLPPQRLSSGRPICSRPSPTTGFRCCGDHRLSEAIRPFSDRSSRSAVWPSGPTVVPPSPITHSASPTPTTRSATRSDSWSTPPVAAHRSAASPSCTAPALRTPD